MQELTRSMQEAIRSTYQVPIAKIEIVDQNNQPIEEITDTLIDASIDVEKDRSVKRSASLLLDNSDSVYTIDPLLYDKNKLWYTTRLKIYFGFKTDTGDEYLPQGVFVINDIDEDIQPDGSQVKLECEDIEGILYRDQFDDIYTIEQDVEQSINYALKSKGAVASATSSLAPGAMIQTQAQVYSIDYYAVVNGIEKKVENGIESNPYNMLDKKEASEGVFFVTPFQPSTYNYDPHPWEFLYRVDPGDTINEIRAEILIDLKFVEPLNSIEFVTLPGTEIVSFSTSYDNVIYNPYTVYSNVFFPPVTSDPEDDVRFIKVVLRKSYGANVFTLGLSEVRIKSNTWYKPELAHDGDIYHSEWRPDPSDPQPIFTMNLNQSASINAIYLYWGNGTFDFENRVKYKLEYSSDSGSTWFPLIDLNGYTDDDFMFGEVEHVLLPRTITNVRIIITGFEGSIKLRHIIIRKATALKYIHDVMEEILETTKITQWDIPISRRYTRRKQAEIGTTKGDFLSSLAVIAGWRYTGTTEDGVYYARPADINSNHPVWDFTPETDNIFSLAPSYTNDINNVVVVVGQEEDEEGNVTPLIGRAIDDNPLSPTYVNKIGRQVIKYQGDSYNTQEICNKIAAERLFDSTHQKTVLDLPVTGHPGLQVNDVVTLDIKKAKIRNSKFLVDGFKTTFRTAEREFNSSLDIIML